MAELTIQISDELAQRLQPLQDQLPGLLAQLVESSSPSSTSTALLSALTNPAQTPLAFVEVLDFLMTRPTPESIAAFKVSEQAQSRLRELLDKHREANLSATETVELDLYEQLDQLVALLKARAYGRMSE